MGLSPDSDGRIFNIGSDHPTTINNLSMLVLREFFGENIPKKFMPKYLPARPQEVKFAYCTHESLRKLMGYRAKTSLADGIKKKVTWAKSVGPQEFQYLDSLDLSNHLTPKTWKNRLL